MKLDLYKILGFLDFYAGGFNQDKAIITHFSTFDNRTGRWERFVEWCSNALKECGIENDILIETKEPNGVRLISRNLITLLLDNFPQYFLGRGAERFDIGLKTSLTFSERKKGLTERKAFLEGCYIRYGNDRKFYVYNDYEKAIFIHRILYSMAEDDLDEIQMRSAFLTPYANIISCDKEGTPLAALLDSFTVQNLDWK
jgi:hypothetical protein